MPLLPYDYLHLVNCPEVVIISDILCYTFINFRNYQRLAERVRSVYWWRLWFEAKEQTLEETWRKVMLSCSFSSFPPNERTRNEKPSITHEINWTNNMLKYLEVPILEGYPPGPGWLKVDNLVWSHYVGTTVRPNCMVHFSGKMPWL